MEKKENKNKNDNIKGLVAFKLKKVTQINTQLKGLGNGKHHNFNNY